MYPLLLFCFFIAFLSFATSAPAQISTQEIRKFEEKNPRVPGSSSPAEIKAIEAALMSEDYTKALELSSDVLNSGGNPLESPQFNQWVKSLAYDYRARATFALKHDWQEALPDIMKSAELGNLESADFLITKFMEVLGYTGSGLGGYVPTEDELIHYFTIAADLMASNALAASTASSFKSKRANLCFR